MENKDIEILLRKYGEGTASEEERALLETWYLQRDVNTIAELSPAEFLEDLELISRGLPLHTPVRKINWLPRIAAAAAVLIVFLAAMFNWTAIKNSLHPAQLSTLTAPAQQTKYLTLADGSQVWVNSGSHLQYPSAFNGNAREVYLSGEAYFDIAHIDHKPFIIHTGSVVTTVLGTAFNIKEDKIKHTIQVTVTRGKVSVANGGKLLGVLLPDQQISVNTTNLQATQQKVDANQVIAWQKVDMRFEDITFAEAAQQLEKRFKVKIGFANAKTGNCRFTGASITGDKLDTILKTICDFNHATYQRQPDGSILISGPGCDN